MYPKYLSSQLPRIIRQTIGVMAIVAAFYSVASIILSQHWVTFLGDLSAFSLLSVSLIYLASESSLTRAGLDWVEAIVLSALFSNAFIQSYELIYHFSFLVYFNYFKWPLLDGDGIRYLVERSLTILPTALLRKHLSFGKLSAASLVLFAALWGTWILYGFPQYFSENSYYPIILEASDRYTTSILLNFGSKLVLAVFFISLLKLSSFKKNLK